MLCLRQLARWVYSFPPTSTLPSGRPGSFSLADENNLHKGERPFFRHGYVQPYETVLSSSLTMNLLLAKASYCLLILTPLPFLLTSEVPSSQLDLFIGSFVLSTVLFFLCIPPRHYSPALCREFTKHGQLCSPKFPPHLCKTQ